MSKTHHQPLMLQITVISAEGLKMKNNYYPLFSPRLRPFITLSIYSSHVPIINGDGHPHVYQTIVDEAGGINPTWGNKFDLPIDTTFFSQNYASIYLQIFSKRSFIGKKQLGWCQIPATDIIEGCSTAGSVRHLSYRVRARDGSKGHGVVNVAVRILGMDFGSFPSSSGGSHSPNDLTYFPASDMCQMTIGFPVALFPAIGE